MEMQNVHKAEQIVLQVGQAIRVVQYFTESCVLPLLTCP